MCTGSKYARSSMYWTCRDQDNDTAAKDMLFCSALCHHADELVLEFVPCKRCPGAPQRRHVIQKAAVWGSCSHTQSIHMLSDLPCPPSSKAFWTKLEYPCLAWHSFLSQILTNSTVSSKAWKNLCLLPFGAFQFWYKKNCCLYSQLCHSRSPTTIRLAWPFDRRA